MRYLVLAFCTQEDFDEQEGLVARLNEAGEEKMERLANALRKLESPGKIRVFGLYPTTALYAAEFLNKQLKKENEEFQAFVNLTGMLERLMECVEYEDGRADTAVFLSPSGNELRHKFAETWSRYAYLFGHRTFGESDTIQYLATIIDFYQAGRRIYISASTPQTTTQ